MDIERDTALRAIFLQTLGEPPYKCDRCGDILRQGENAWVVRGGYMEYQPRRGIHLFKERRLDTGDLAKILCDDCFHLALAVDNLPNAEETAGSYYTCPLCQERMQENPELPLDVCGVIEVWDGQIQEEGEFVQWKSMYFDANCLLEVTFQDGDPEAFGLDPEA